ncbi:MAG: hypothetical protein K6E98_03085 [Lachnospiraceae bacterium]|nr:hypothetical protein [Lachnospiraceae bacterium]
MQLKSYLRGLGCGLFISAVLMGIAVSYSKKTLSDEEIKIRAAELGMVEEDSLLLKPSGTDEKSPVIEVNTGEEEAPADKDNDTGTDIKTEIKAETGDEEKTDIKAETGNEEKNDTASATEDEEKSDIASAAEDEEKSDITSATVDEEKKDIKTGTGDEPADEMQGAEDIKDEDRLAAMGMNDDPTDPDIANVRTGSYTLEISKGTSSDGVARLLEKGNVIEDASDFDNYLCRNNYDKKIHHGIFKIPEGAGYEEIAKIITRSN